MEGGNSILCILENEGTVRFGQIKKKLDNISNVMLSKTLKELEQDGIITRHQYNEVPPHVDYTLTEKGKNVIPALITGIMQLIDVKPYYRYV